LPIQNDLLEILCDPVTKTPLRLLTAAQLSAVNAAIRDKQVKNVEGTLVLEALQEGLITSDGKTIYRIDNDIPIMLAEHGIAAEQVGGL
jgi:uncharacterized protein YbaR (Trm112 family)